MHLVQCRTSTSKKERKKERVNEKGSGCESVGRVVASDTRVPWFESSHQQIVYTIRRRKNKPQKIANDV